MSGKPVMTPERRRELASRFPTTEDTFIAAVPWGESRTVLVYRRTFGSREYVRLRTWNRHRDKGVWYPSPRNFIIPIQNAEALGRAIVDAAHGCAKRKPAWLVEREAAEVREIELMRELGARADTVDEASRKLSTERRSRV